MPDLKLTYFDFAGRGEPIRLALTIGDIPFEDCRLSRPEWLKLKPSTPYGSLPVLAIDGVDYAQSDALLRYCGRLAGLYPEDAKHAMLVDEAIATVHDATQNLFSYKGDDKEKLKAVRTKVIEEDFPRYFGALDKRLNRLTEGPWAVGENISIADLTIYMFVGLLRSGYIDFVPATSIDEYTKLTEVYNKVVSHPKVVEWNKAHAA